MERSLDKERGLGLKQGGPPEWNFYWKQTGANRIEVRYGDTVFRYILQDGRLKYSKRMDDSRVSRHLTDAEYNRIREEAKNIFQHLKEEAEASRQEDAPAASLEKSNPEQFEFKFH